MDAFEKKEIRRVRDGRVEVVDDLVAVEKRVRILVNGAPVLSLFCTPVMIRELVVGLVVAEGLIEGEWCADRIAIEYGDEIVADIPSTGSIRVGEKVRTSGCAGGVSLANPQLEGVKEDLSSVTAAEVFARYAEFQKLAEGYRLTGGLHSAALADRGKLIVFAEDVGRHNAVDKAIGYSVLEGVAPDGKMMLASGRLSSEIVGKCARRGIPILVSRSAPTSLAIRLAEQTGITLIGFVRGGRMNLYSGAERVVL